MWMVLLVMSCSPQVMKIFCPKRRKRLPSGTARVRTCARSEPAWGSVRSIVPVHSPLIIFGRNSFFWTGEPDNSSACTAPCVSMGHNLKARFAEAQNSCTADARTCGASCPPYSGGAPSCGQPPAMNC